MATEAMLSTFNATSTRCGVWGLGSGVWGVPGMPRFPHPFENGVRKSGSCSSSFSCDDCSWPLSLFLAVLGVGFSSGVIQTLAWLARADVV